MILAVDIGNTHVSFAVLKGARVLKNYTTDSRTSKTRLRSDLKKTLGRIKRAFPQIKRAVICSVVPEVLSVCEGAIRRSLALRPAVIGRDLKVPIRNNYRKPSQVGQDRLVCAYAAKYLYGQPAIVIDFGTATTFDIVSRSGSYEGGLIIPGLRLSAESLFQKTALLPRIHMIEAPRALVGKDTKASILSGLFFGYGAMCCGLIDQITKKAKGRPKVVVTGGHTRMMKKFISRKITRIDKDLVFKGMGILVKNAAAA